MLKQFEFVDLEQRSPEWHQFRRSHIMASDAPKIMGVSPWGTPLSLWEEKLGFRKPQEDNHNMKRGRDLEDEALEFYNKFTNQSLKPRVAVSREYEFIGASYDGISECGQHIVEIKCPKIKSNTIPEKYVPQLQHQMFVTGAKEVHYFEYINSGDCPEFLLIKMLLNKEYAEEMINKEIDFHFNLMSMISPEPTKKDYIYRSDEEYYKAVNKWFAARDERVLCEEIEEQCKAALLKEVNYNNTKGLGVTIKKQYKTGKVDYSVVEEVLNMSEEELDKYRNTPSQYWRIDG